MGPKVNCYCCPAVGGYREITLHGKSFKVCGYCFTAISSFIQHRANGHAINVIWGGGKFDLGSWTTLKSFLREHKIDEVLEFGTGLSSELMVLEGIKLTSLDVLKNHSQLFQNHKLYKDKAEFIYYEPGNIPNLSRTWPLVVVDGPQRRAPEVRAAMKYSSEFIYLHDPNLGEEGFFPNEEWKEIKFKFYGKSN